MTRSCENSVGDPQFEWWWAEGTPSKDNPYPQDSRLFWAWEGWVGAKGCVSREKDNEGHTRC